MAKFQDFGAGEIRPSLKLPWLYVACIPVDSEVYRSKQWLAGFQASTVPPLYLPSHTYVHVYVYILMVTIQYQY